MIVYKTQILYIVWLRVKRILVVAVTRYAERSGTSFVQRSPNHRLKMLRQKDKRRVHKKANLTKGNNMVTYRNNRTPTVRLQMELMRDVTLNS